MRKTGLAIDDWPGSLTVVLIEAPLQQAAEALAELFQTQATPTSLADVGSWGEGTPVFRLAGQPHAVAVIGASLPDRLAAALSAALQTEVLFVGFEDCSGWLSYELYRAGERAEGFSTGLDYSEEMEEFGGYEEQVRPPGRWTVDERADGEQHLFFSADPALRPALDELRDPTFMDGALRRLGVYVPSWAEIPAEQTPEQTAGALEGVLLLGALTIPR